MPKRRRRTETAARENQQPDLFDAIERSDEARQRMRAILAMGDGSEPAWRGWAAVPPETFLARAVSVFQTETDIPLEIPFAAALVATAAELTRRGITAEFEGVTVRPRAWMVVLAESGTGKTTATDYVLNAIGADDRIRDPVSAPAMIEAINEATMPLWYRDEFGLWLRDLEHGMRQTMKPYLLELYSGRRIEWRRTSKGDEDRSLVLDPDHCAVSFLGTTVGTTLYKCMSAESLLDGFAARFAYLYADIDPARPPERFPLYRIERHAERLRDEWDALWKPWDTVNKRTLVADAEAADAFEEGFKIYAEHGVPRAFLRRTMWSSLSYAIAYQANLGTADGKLSNIAVEWAGRLTGLMLRDTRRLLNDLQQGDFARTIARGIEYVERYRRRHGEIPSRRRIISSVRGVRNAQEAAAILQMVEEDRR